MSRPPVWAKKKKKAGGVGFQGPSWAGKLDGCCHDTEGCARRVAQRERERVEDMELGVMTADDDDVPVSVHGWYGMVDVSVRSTRRICMSMFVHVGMHVYVCRCVCRCMQV
jgi:hypothetical protein